MLEWIRDNRLWLLLAFGVGFTAIELMRHREKLNIHWWAALLLSMVYALLGVLSVRTFAAIERWDFSSFDGMSMFGTVFFMPVFYWLGAKCIHCKPALFFDILTPCIVFVLLCTRINCMLSGCCLGTFIPGTTYRFPTREAEIAFFALLILFFFRQDEKKAKDGRYFPIYMVAYGTFRFFQEGFRSAEVDTYLHIGHLWAALSIIIGLIILTLDCEKLKKHDAPDRNQEMR